MPSVLQLVIDDNEPAVPDTTARRKFWVHSMVGGIFRGCSLWDGKSFGNASRTSLSKFLCCSLLLCPHWAGWHLRRSRFIVRREGCIGSTRNESAGWFRGLPDGCRLTLVRLVFFFQLISTGRRRLRPKWWVRKLGSLAVVPDVGLGSGKEKLLNLSGALYRWD